MSELTVEMLDEMERDAVMQGERGRGYYRITPETFKLLIAAARKGLEWPKHEEPEDERYRRSILPRTSPRGLAFPYVLDTDRSVAEEPRPETMAPDRPATEAAELVERLESHMGKQYISILLADCREAAALIRSLSDELDNE